MFSIFSSMQSICVFDLDNTLLTDRCVVPRQTWHKLRQLQQADWILGVVSNNSLAPLVAASVGLASYIALTSILVQTSTEETRPALLRRWLDTICPHVESVPRLVHFFDDRCNQVDAVCAATWPSEWTVKAHHVQDVYTLHRVIAREVFSK